MTSRSYEGLRIALNRRRRDRSQTDARPITDRTGGACPTHMSRTVGEGSGVGCLPVARVGQKPPRRKPPVRVLPLTDASRPHRAADDPDHSTTMAPVCMSIPQPKRSSPGRENVTVSSTGWFSGSVRSTRFASDR